MTKIHPTPNGVVYPPDKPIIPRQLGNNSHPDADTINTLVFPFIKTVDKTFKGDYRFKTCNDETMMLSEQYMNHLKLGSTIHFFFLQQNGDGHGHTVLKVSDVMNIASTTCHSTKSCGSSDVKQCFNNMKAEFQLLDIEYEYADSTLRYFLYVPMVNNWTTNNKGGKAFKKTDERVMVGNRKAIVLRKPGSRTRYVRYQGKTLPYSEVLRLIKTKSKSK